VSNITGTNNILFDGEGVTVDVDRLELECTGTTRTDMYENRGSYNSLMRRRLHSSDNCSTTMGVASSTLYKHHHHHQHHLCISCIMCTSDLIFLTLAHCQFYITLQYTTVLPHQHHQFRAYTMTATNHGNDGHSIDNDSQTTAMTATKDDGYNL